MIEEAHVYIKESKSNPRNFLYAIENKISKSITADTLYTRNFTPFQLRNSGTHLFVIGNNDVAVLDIDEMSRKKNCYMLYKDDKVSFTEDKEIMNDVLLATLIKLANNRVLLVTRSEVITSYCLTNDTIDMLPRGTDLVEDFLNIETSKGIISTVDKRLFTDVNTVELELKANLVKNIEASIEINTAIKYELIGNKLILDDISKGSNPLKIQILIDGLHLEMQYDITRI